MNCVWLGLTLVITAEPTAPAKEPPAVVCLIEDTDDRWLERLNNDGGLDNTKARLEYRDFYSGISSVRITPHQRFCSKIDQWSFSIVEKPQLGQYRYIRFAWKRLGGEGIMLQLHSPERSWNQRYFAGKAAASTSSWGPMLQVADTMPNDWTVVTRDLFKDFGTLTITGLALTTMEGGTAGLFDHVYLGRTLDDLDALAPMQLAKRALLLDLSRKELEQAWDDLGSKDPRTANTAIHLLLGPPKLTLPFVQAKLDAIKPKDASIQEIRQLIEELDADRFRTREAASAALGKIGRPALPLLKRALQASPSEEVRERTRVLIEKLQTEPEHLTSEQVRFIRAIRIVERTGTPESRTMLEQLAKQYLDSEWHTDIAASLKRAAQR